MDCKRVSEVVFTFFDNELEDEQVPPFQTHTQECPFCARQVSYTQKLLVTIRKRCRRHLAPERLRVRIIEELRRRTPQRRPTA